MKLSHYKHRWPEPVVPAGEPEWLVYAVDIETDCVVRTVEIFSGGKMERNNLELESRHEGVFTSLIDGSFSELLSEWSFEEVPESEFEFLYSQSTDKPRKG